MTMMIEERRRVERRTMPAEIRTLVEELRAISRAPGAQTRDGREWRTINKGTIDMLIDVLVRTWRPDPPADQPVGGR
jgi:hypothetical protein